MDKERRDRIIQTALSARRRAIRKVQEDKRGIEKDLTTEQAEKAHFVGEEVFRNAFQSALNAMEQNSRLAAFHDEIEHHALHRMCDMALTAKESDDLNLKGDAKSIAMEYGSMIGAPQLIEDDETEEEGLYWVTEDYMQDMYDRKRALSYLFDGELDNHLP